MALNKTDYLKQLDYMYQLYKHKDLLRNQIKLIHQAKQAMVHKMLSGR